MAKVSALPPRWLTVSGGLSAIATAGIALGLLATRTGLSPLLAGLVSVVVTFVLSFWAMPRLRRAADPAAHRPEGPPRLRESSSDRMA